MMATLTPIPPRVPLTDQKGIITSPWLLYFQALFNRVGGATGMSSAQLEAALMTLAAGEMVLQSRTGDVIFGDVLQPAIYASVGMPETMQASAQQDPFSDVYQTPQEACLSEMIFQH